MSIEGFDESVAQELQNRALAWIEKIQGELTTRMAAIGVDETLINCPGVKNEWLELLAENDVKSLEDFAGLAGDELVEILPESGLSEQEAGEIIMEARRKAGWLDGEA